MWALVLVLLTGAGWAAVTAAWAAPERVPSVTLSKPLPLTIRQDSTIVVAGRVLGSARATRATFDVKRATWATVASAPVGAKRRFTITWQVPRSQLAGPVSLRVTVRNRHGVITRTKPVQAGIGAAPELCAPPVPPAVDIPVGDGWIVGGRYFAGGPFPGIYNCDSAQYTITATDSGGIVQATQTVAGGQSYTLVVPAGTYALKSDFCSGTATVTAGSQTAADTVCPVP